MFATTLTALALVSAATAQMTIQVGAEATTSGGIFQYIPNTMNATNGTVITFEFSGAPGNHSVTQSSFADPCTPLQGGFDSGWILLPDAPSTPPLWNLTITDDSKPIWFFCKQLVPMPHCSAGMVGAINPPTSGANTFANYLAAAMKFQGNSGQSVGGLVGIGASASAGIGPVPTDGMIFGEPSGATLATSAGSSPTSAGSSPTATAPSSTGAAGTSAAASPTTASSASNVGAGFISVVIAAIAGIALA